MAGEEVTAHPTVARVRDRFPDAFVSAHDWRGDLTVQIAPAAVEQVCRFLRDDPELAFDMLLDVTAVDYIGSAPRFEVVYHLYSLRRRARLRLKARVPEQDPRVPTLVEVWKTANWQERETWDMYGIRFDGHPDLRRIYLYEEFEGHPLRKDYPKERRQPLIGRRAVRPGEARRQDERERERYGRWT